MVTPNARIIDINDREQRGDYLINPDSYLIFPFIVPQNKTVPVEFRELQGDGGQDFSIFAWLSEHPQGPEIIINRWHPGTGGAFQLFYDKTINPPPQPTIYSETISPFNGIAYTIRDVLIPVEGNRTYYYNVRNLERRERAFSLFFD